MEAAVERLLRVAFGKFVQGGKLRITTAGGTVLVVGESAGPEVAIRFTSRLTELSVLLDPELKLGEAYMDGTLLVEHGSIADFLFMLCPRGLPPRPQWTWPQWLWRYARRRLAQFNPRSRARGATSPTTMISTSSSIRCSWTPTGNTAAPTSNGRISRSTTPSSPRSGTSPPSCCSSPASACSKSDAAGVVLRSTSPSCWTPVSPASRCPRNSTRLALRRTSEKGLSKRMTFRLQDYRDVQDKFDRIVSVGMFEHVGVGFYDTFFRKCYESLEDDGVMLLHSIGRSEGPAVTNPWVAKYIFPGGYIPALSEVLPAVERAGLLVTDIEILRLHYADTLRAWRQRFVAHRDEVEEVYDARFVRMWEFYLAAAEVGFREHAMMVFQIQLTKQQGVVPVTRDYIMYAEAQLRAREGSSRPTLRLAGE